MAQLLLIVIILVTLKSHWWLRDEKNDGILRIKDKKFSTPQDGHCYEAQAWRRAVRGRVRGDLEEIQRHHRRQDAQGKLDIEQDAEQWAKEGLINHNGRITLETMPLAVKLNNLALRTVHNINYQQHVGFFRSLGAFSEWWSKGEEKRAAKFWNEHWVRGGEEKMSKVLAMIMVMTIMTKMMMTMMMTT